ncbi:MAG: 50S ribosomal protein L10 [Nanohaloarchaea archaeon QH_8_44_6]|nr:MAG: 50S ribosomal protein L10 [Nanohaloarchaea archaeon QH_8_44_6]
MVQPTPKGMTREQKEAKVEEFEEKIEDYPVVGILDMHNLPAKQLQQIKKDMKAFADVKMSRKTLMEIAIDGAEKEDIEQLEETEATQPAFIFSEKDPFQLYQLIKENKTSAAAQGGEEAPNDIEVPDGDTGIGPGPMLGKLQQRGLQVQVSDGSIHVQEPGVIIEKGDTITRDDAEILSQLGIEPLEIGLDLDIAYSEGELFTAGELDIDTEQYRTDVETASSAAFNLAVNAGIINETTAETIVQEAVKKAKNLAISEGLPVEETIEKALAHASGNAEGLDSQLDLESVNPEDETEEDTEDEEEAEEESEAEDESDSEEESGEDEESDEDSESEEE